MSSASSETTFLIVVDPVSAGGGVTYQYKHSWCLLHSTSRPVETAWVPLSSPLGVCHGTISAPKKKRWCMRFERSQFEERCMREFWSKNEAVLRSTIEAEACDPDEVWTEIAKFINSVTGCLNHW